MPKTDLLAYYPKAVQPENKSAAAGAPSASPAAAAAVDVEAEAEAAAKAARDAAAKVKEAESAAASKAAAAQRARAYRANRATKARKLGTTAGAITSFDNPRVAEYRKDFVWLDTTSESAKNDVRNGVARCGLCVNATFGFTKESLKDHDASASHKAAAAAVAEVPSAAGFATVQMPSKLRYWRRLLGSAVGAALVAGGIPPEAATTVLRPLAPALRELGSVPTDASIRQQAVPKIARALEMDLKEIVAKNPGVLLSDGATTKFGDGTTGSTGVFNWLWYTAKHPPLLLKSFLSRSTAEEDGITGKDIKVSPAGSDLTCMPPPS